MRFPLIVFDFDGTLADSFARAVVVFQRIGPQLGLKPLADIESARGMPTKQLLKTMGVSFWKLPKLMRAFHAEAAKDAAGLKLFPDWKTVLNELHSAGHQLGILSSNSEANIRTTLAANGVESLFSLVVGYPKLFGKARALRRILKTQKVERSQTLYVGDEVRDIEAAKKAGITIAACNWGFHTESLLATAKPDRILTNPRELLTLVT